MLQDEEGAEEEVLAKKRYITNKDIEKLGSQMRLSIIERLSSFPLFFIFLLFSWCSLFYCHKSILKLDIFVSKRYTIK